MVQTPEGDLEPDVLKIIEGIGTWTSANGEGIYGTRPWLIYGEGPSTIKTNQQKGRFGGLSDTRGYQGTDIRFTTKMGSLYAYCMNIPTSDIRILSLGKNSRYLRNSIGSVTMLGSKEKLMWTQEEDALVITKPANMSAWNVTGFKIQFQK